MLVLKFGGTSLGTAQRIRSAAAIIADAAEQQRTVVVVSALAGTTDRLLRMIDLATQANRQWLNELDALEQRHLECLREILGGDHDSLLAGELRARLGRLRRLLDGVTLLREHSPRIRDRIQASGERLSAILTVAALRSIGKKAVAVDGGRLIRTDSTFGEANVDPAATRELVTSWLMGINSETIPIVTGFIGANDEGKTTTLGRGGSDLSAAVLGAALEAERVEIWTDVDGVLSASPKIVDKPHILDRLSYQMAAELAYFGAKVLHRKTMAPLERNGIPILIRNTISPSGGFSEVSTRTDREIGVRAVTAVHDATSFTLHSDKNSDAAQLFRILSSSGLEPLLADLAPAARRLVLVVPTNRARSVEMALSNLESRSIQVEREDDKSLIALVGDRIDEPAQTATEAFSILLQAKISIQAVSSGISPYSLSFLLDRKEMHQAVQILHETFIQNKDRERDGSLSSAVDVTPITSVDPERLSTTTKKRPVRVVAESGR
jgi:aspartokinase/homoserine dehydrogenase 1